MIYVKSITGKDFYASFSMNRDFSYNPNLIYIAPYQICRAIHGIEEANHILFNRIKDYPSSLFKDPRKC